MEDRHIVSYKSYVMRFILTLYIKISAFDNIHVIFLNFSFIINMKSTLGGVTLKKLSKNKFLKGIGTAVLGIILLIGMSACTTFSTEIEQRPLTSEKSKEAFAVDSDSNNDAAGQLKVHFIDVGQADCILVQQGNSYMLVDAGNNADEPLIKDYLEGLGIKEFQVVVGTHVHEDHIGSMDYIINSFKVGKVYFPRQTASTKTFNDFVSAVKNKGLQITTPKVGDTFKLGESTCTILAPNSDSYKDANDYSIVIKVTYGNTSFLLTGDAEAVSEMEMVKNGLNLKADVLKISHHGSRTSTVANFLRAVSPEYAVISVGTGNTYGHPAQTVLDRLKNAGVKVYRTDESGTVIATSNGSHIIFNTQAGSYKGIASNTEINSGEPEATPSPQPSTGELVYWLTTSTAKTYHKDTNCQYIRGKQIRSGSVQDATKEGKGDPCKRCIK
jgi:competence protein ComEC